MQHHTFSVLEDNELGDLLDIVAQSHVKLVNFYVEKKDSFFQIDINYEGPNLTAVLQAWHQGPCHTDNVIAAPSLEEGLEKYTVTLIGRSIAAAQLARVCKALNLKNLNILGLRRLSGESETISGKKTCYEILTIGKAHLVDKLRPCLKKLGEEIGLDCCINQTSWRRDQIALVVFDMDSTLIQCECIDEMARRHGVGEKVSLITAAAMRGEIDFSASFTRRVALLEGLSEATLQEITAKLPLTEGVVYLMQSLKKMGLKTALFSGGFYYFANHLKDTLAIDFVYANELPMANGQVTGKVSSLIVDGQQKKEKLMEIAAGEKLHLSQIVAVGDGANDLPMIKVAGMGVAFHAKPLVRQEAANAISTVGLDGLLYLLGVSDDELNKSD